MTRHPSAGDADSSEMVWPVHATVTIPPRTFQVLTTGVGVGAGAGGFVDVDDDAGLVDFEGAVALPLFAGAVAVRTVGGELGAGGIVTLVPDGVVVPGAGLEDASRPDT